MDLHAIRQVTWQVTCGIQWHIVLDGVPDPLGEGRFGGRNPNQNMLQLQIATATWWITTKSDSVFYQFTLIRAEVFAAVFNSCSVYILIRPPVH